MIRKVMIIFITILNMYIYAEPKMIDLKNILTVLDALDPKTGKFIGSKDIQTPEDLLIEVHFNLTPKSNQLILNELPMAKEGALRLCSLLLFNIAQNPIKKIEYSRRIKNMKENSTLEHITYFSLFDENDKFIHSVYELNDYDIDNYYSEAIKNKINSIPVSYLTPDEEKSARELLHTYCIKPEKENIAKLRLLTKHLADKNLKKAYGIMTIVKELSEDIFNLIYE